MNLKTLAAAATALTLLTAGAGPASAMPLGGLSEAANTVSKDVTNVRWVCGPYRCWWRPSYYVAPPPPPYYGYYGYWGPRWRWHRHWW